MMTPEQISEVVLGAKYNKKGICRNIEVKSLDTKTEEIDYFKTWMKVGLPTWNFSKYEYRLIEGYEVELWEQFATNLNNNNVAFDISYMTEENFHQAVARVRVEMIEHCILTFKDARDYSACIGELELLVKLIEERG